MAIGAQDGFNWKSVALSAIAGGIGGSFSQPAPLGGSGLQNTIIRAAVVNATTQSIGVVTGLQDRFSWTAVAASAVGAGMSEAINSEMLGAQTLSGRTMDTDFVRAIGDATTAKVVAGTFAGMVSGTTTALMRGGRVSVQQIATDAFGNALGQGLVDSMQPEPVAGSGVNLKPGATESWGPKYSFEDTPLPIDYSIAGGGSVRLGGVPSSGPLDDGSPVRSASRVDGVEHFEHRAVAQADADPAELQRVVITGQRERLAVTGEAPGEYRFDTRIAIAGPSGLTKPDGSAATYSFNRGNGQAYWNAGDAGGALREIPRAYRMPTLDDLVNDPSNPFANQPRIGAVLADVGVLSGAGALGLGIGGIVARGVMGVAADTSAYGLQAAYLMNASGVNATGLLGAELALGYDAVSPSPMLLGSGGRNAIHLGEATLAERVPLFSQAGGTPGVRFPHTEGLAARASMAELMESGALPGQRGVVLTDRAVRFGDLYTLSDNAGGIEFSLVSQRIDGRLEKVLYSGDAWTSPVPFGARPIAHVHPNAIPGQDTPSLADINLLSDRHYERLLANPTAVAEPSRIIWGPGNADNTIYYGGVGKAFNKVETPKGIRYVYP